MTMSDSGHADRPWRDPRWSELLHRNAHKLVGLALAAIVIVLLATALGGWWWCNRFDREAVALLESPEPEYRKLGAWLTASHAAPRARSMIAERLRSGVENDASVRESYVYALGRAAQPEFFEIIAAVIRQERAPYVRQAAWVAAARTNPAGFRRLADEVPESDAGWDRLGRACAYLEIGDMRGVTTLLDFAAGPDAEHRRVASHALYRLVAPLLEAAGRWPLAAAVRDTDTWPPELVAEIRRRCEELDLQAVADDTRPHLGRSAFIRRNVWRLTSTRDRLARLLLRG